MIGSNPVVTHAAHEGLRKRENKSQSTASILPNAPCRTRQKVAQGHALPPPASRGRTLAPTLYRAALRPHAMRLLHLPRIVETNCDLGALPWRNRDGLLFLRRL